MSSDGEGDSCLMKTRFQSTGGSAGGRLSPRYCVRSSQGILLAVLRPLGGVLMGVGGVDRRREWIELG